MKNRIEKRKQAVALAYDEKQADTPVIVAKGKGLTADKILAEAKKHQIPIQEDSSLVELLGKLNINEKIPEELYQVVAEVFAFIYRSEQLLNKK